MYRSNAKPYVQCWLRKGNRSHVAWLPEKFAVVDQALKLRASADGEWDDGWIVMACYQRSLHIEDLEKARRGFAGVLR